MEPSDSEVVSPLARVNCEHIDAALYLYGDALKKALEDHSLGERTIEDYRKMFHSGEAQLWILALPSGRMQLAAITRILVYPKKKVLSIDLVVGSKMESAYPLLVTAERWAAVHGCRDTVSYVRPGARKIAEKYGFSKAYEVITRPIGVN